MTARTPAQTGQAVLDLAQAGRFAEISELFAPPLRAMVPPEALEAAWAAAISQRGPVRQIGSPDTEPVPGGAVVTIPVTFTGGQTTVVVTVSDDGWLGGIQLRPAGQEEEPAGPWQPPPYADPGSFREQEVTLGTGPLAVPGTLTLPRQGGVAPRVATAGPPVAGLVIMAGGAEPLHWAMVRQFRYLAALDPSPLAAPQQVLAAVTRQAELVDSPDLSPATPAADLPFAVPAAYWLDLRGYDPPAAAAALAKPVLLLQGGRDYQVTVADDLSRWRTGLAGRPDVTVHVYEADNHLFFPGFGRSAPAEYEPAQHLDPAVVADIAAWLASTAPGGQAGSADPGGSLPLG